MYYVTKSLGQSGQIRFSYIFIRQANNIVQHNI